MGATLIAGILFGGVGFVAFAFGKKESSFKHMIIGAFLMVYPYFISNVTALFAIGIILTIALFVRTD